MDAIVRYDNVVKHYKTTNALNGLNYSVESGTVTAMIGPNGAGKTTALKIINKLISASGSVRLFGKDIAEISDQELIGKLFFVPEEKSLPTSIKIGKLIDNIGNFKKAGIDFDLLNSNLKLFNLNNKKDLAVRELSLGMRTALYLAVALSSQSELLILDEPLSGLDPIIRSRVIDKIRGQAIAGKTVIYSSHIMEEVEEVADRILIINKGRALFEGSIDSAKDKYSEYIIESPKDIEKIKSMPGVLYVKRNRGDVYNIFVDNKALKKPITGKKFNLKLKEIFIYLIEMDDSLLLEI